MTQHKGPRGQGYMPKGGAKKAQQHNATWAIEQDALMRARSSAPTSPDVSGTFPAGVQVRASAPEAPAVTDSHAGLLVAVERACYAGMGGIVGTLFTLVSVGYWP